MVLSDLESGRERQTGGIRHFSMAHENYAETFMEVENTTEDNLCGTISSGQEKVRLLCAAFMLHRTLLILFF
jgi:hypothetical protein